MSTTVDACTHAEQRMQAYLDGLLTTADKATVELHLEQCSPCACAYRFEVKLRHHLKACTGCEDEERCREELLAKLKSLCCEGHED